MFVYVFKFTTLSNKVYVTNPPIVRALHWNLVLAEILFYLKKKQNILGVPRNLQLFIKRVNSSKSVKFKVFHNSNVCPWLSNHFYTLNKIQKACNLDTKWSCFDCGLPVFSFPLHGWTVGHCLQKQASDCIILLTFGVGCQFLRSSYRGRLLRNSYQFWKFIRTMWSSLSLTKVWLREKGKVPESRKLDTQVRQDQISNHELQGQRSKKP